jgi:hypothetical protein
VVAAIARGLYKRPSQVSPYVGSGLDEVCGRCLQVLPAERYPDLLRLAADLRGFCRAGGLVPDEVALPALISEPERFEAALRPKVADAAVAQARRHSRRGELGRALGELARATAYVPRHAEAEKLVASISWRRRWLKVTGAAAAVAAVACAGIWLGPRVREMALKCGGASRWGADGGDRGRGRSGLRLHRTPEDGQRADDGSGSDAGDPEAACDPHGVHGRPPAAQS